MRFPTELLLPDTNPRLSKFSNQKKKGAYNIVKIDADYVPAEIETKEVFGVTFEQGRNNYKISKEILTNVVTANKEIPDSAKLDLIVALITLKYTQSNSVCYAVDGQAIGVGAGQQSRIHCTRLAGKSKADIWHLRRHPKVLALPFLPTLGRPDRDNVIDVYISDRMRTFSATMYGRTTSRHVPKSLQKPKRTSIFQKSQVLLLLPTRSSRSATTLRGQEEAAYRMLQSPEEASVMLNVIETCDKYNMAMCFTGMRLFHH